MAVNMTCILKGHIWVNTTNISIVGGVKYRQQKCSRCGKLRTVKV